MIAVRRGWFHLASGAGFGRILGFVSNLLLSRWLGPTHLGLFNLVTTTVQTADTLVRCGGDYALNFELGSQQEAMNTESGRKLAQGLNQLCSLITVLILFVAAIWVWWGQSLFPISIVGIQRLFLTCLLLLMIACEGISASAWELLLVTHRTAPLALRNGLFIPLRLLFAALGSFFGGFSAAMLGWCIIAIVQCIWLKIVLRELWQPFQIWPLLVDSLRQLLNRGLPFYAVNLLSSMIFYPLLLKVASASGLSELGNLRVGQIMQQLFAFLPATLVPVLFLKLRGEQTYARQVHLLEKPLRIIWFLLLEILLLYCTVDQAVLPWLFGSGYVSALLPTRMLLLTALFECLAQLIVQPLLATGKTSVYGLWQNGAAILAASIGWFWIPNAGLAAYLIVRLFYVTVPLMAFGLPVAQMLQEPLKMTSLIMASISLLVVLLFQIATAALSYSFQPLFVLLFILILFFSRHDLALLYQGLRKS